MARNNTRHQCQDCLLWAMSKKKTANTPRLMDAGTPFCTECVEYWDAVEVELPPHDIKCSQCKGAGIPPGWEEDVCPSCSGTGKHTLRARTEKTYRCRECEQVVEVYYEKADYGATARDWKHAETCSALHDPCACKVRNKRPGQRRCNPCSRPVHKYLAAEAQKDYVPPVRRSKDKRRNPNPHMGEEMSPAQENAMRAREDS